MSNDREKFDLSMAIAEAGRCLLCYDAPCSKGCPAGTDPGTFLRKLHLKNITGAIRTIKNNNILGGACGRLCPTARLCEKECSATGISRPIEIGKVQAALVEYSWRAGIKTLEKNDNVKAKVAVVGAGPAGLSCAAELAKEGVEVVMFESRAEPGGVLRYGVPSERLPLEFLQKEISEIAELGVRFECQTTINQTKDIENLLKEGFDAVFLATGLWESIKLKTKSGNRPEGVISSLEFLEAARNNKPVVLKNKTVSVIGGGSVATDCAQSALKFGAREVNIIYRRTFLEMPAEENEKIAAFKSGINLILLNRLIEYLGDNKLKAIELLRTRLGEAGDDGRRTPVDIPESNWELASDVVIEAIGYSSPLGLIKVNLDNCKTSAVSVYAGGDIVRGPSLVVNAVRDGKVAATEILKGLKARNKK